MSSNKGSFRGGKSRDKAKSFCVLFGKARSSIWEERELEEVITVGFRRIPSNTPHLMNFESYSWVIEWWDKEAKATKFELFYDRKK